MPGPVESIRRQDALGFPPRFPSYPPQYEDEYYTVSPRIGRPSDAPFYQRGSSMAEVIEMLTRLRGLSRFLSDEWRRGVESQRLTGLGEFMDQGFWYRNHPRPGPRYSYPPTVSEGERRFPGRFAIPDGPYAEDEYFALPGRP